jgi:hypothetical protein
MKAFNKLFLLIIGSSNDNKSLLPRLIVGLVFFVRRHSKILVLRPCWRWAFR